MLRARGINAYSLYIADKVVRIENDNGHFYRYCRGYIVKEPAPEPDYVISVTQGEIEAHRKNMDGFSDMLISGSIILRKLSSKLLEDERTLLVHGSVIACQDSAFLFTAPSQTGKTTHSRLWAKYLPDAYILNGDKPFVSTEDSIFAWGSPWSGSEGYSRNEGVVLKAICFLERAEKNRIAEISTDEAIPKLAQQTGNPDPEDYRMKIWIMEGLSRLRGRVKFYRYEMNNFEEKEAFHTTYDVLSQL